MARLKLQLAGEIQATIHIPVRITDINYGNHLGNDSMISFVHEARMQWLTRGGYSEMNLAGVGSIMSELQVEYKRQVYYGDNLYFQISIGEISSVHFEIYYRIVNQHQEEIALAKTGLVSFDYERNKVVPIPKEFKNYLLSGG